MADTGTFFHTSNNKLDNYMGHSDSWLLTFSAVLPQYPYPDYAVPDESVEYHTFRQDDF